MEFRNDADLAPAMRNTRDKNHDFLARAKLMGRDPAGADEWIERYAVKFRELYTKDDAFRELVSGELSDEALTRLQERLNEAG